MTPNQLQLYTVMKPDVEHVDEICADIRAQIEQGIATCVLFSMTLVPEGNPPADKAETLCRAFDVFRERLAPLGIPVGILVQATIGHGWVLSERSPFQPYVNLSDGAVTYTTCPYDAGFLDYLYDAIRTVAKHAPTHIMIDDDLRLIHRKGGGCACPLHMKRLGELAGNPITREQLVEAVRQELPEKQTLEPLFVQTQREAVLEAARVIRDAIDSVDPTLPASFCCVGKNAEFAAEIATVLAGKGNPRVVRINNARYAAAGTRFFTDKFFKARAQIEKLRGKVDLILAETDTCPQNRYSTSASSLHTQFTGSILEGAKGAKHWITRMIAYEPESGKAYRRKLAAHRGFYEQLAAWEPSLAWRGCRIPVLREALYTLLDKDDGANRTNAWGLCLLERFGIPMYFSSEDGGVLCLEGDSDLVLSVDEIHRALHSSLLLSSDAAARLVARGFGKHLGVAVRDWQGLTPSYEIDCESGLQIKLQVGTRELIPTSDATQVHSTVYHGVVGKEQTPLFPGAVSYRNELGGRVLTFCGTPNTSFTLSEAFSFLNQTRKRQLISMLKATGELPVYAPGDEEIYLRCADMEDGALFCALFNLGWDPIERTELVFAHPVSRIERLMPDGTLCEVAFEVKNGRTILDVPCNVLDPLILRVN